MSFAIALKCRECGRHYPQELLHVCDYCFGPLEVAYDYEAMRGKVTRESIEAGPNNIWRYAGLLPIEPRSAVQFNTGFTPLVRAENLGRELGLRNLYVKNDCVNPSYSFKDRPVSVATSKARELGLATIACASTGNLAGAVAAQAAKAGMKAFVFIPYDLELGKVLGAGVYNPILVKVKGTYDDVNRLCSEIADMRDWGFVNINLRPYYAEGSKTLGLEVAEQLGWRAPDRVIVPMASGALFTKIWKAFHELYQLGLIDSVSTCMTGAQAEGCSPITTAFKAGSLDVHPVRPNTIAKSLAIGNPADGYYCLKIMEESGGGAESVTDDEVVEGIKLLAATEGIFAETAGGVTVGVLRKLARSGALRPDELIVAYITGNGLKTQEAIADHVAEPLLVEPNLRAFEQALSDRAVAA